MMKTLPGAALQIYVLVGLPGLLRSGIGGGGWGDGEKWTNELDSNEEELSQEIARARTTQADAAGLLPASPRMVSAATAVRLPWESKRQNKNFRP